MPDPEAIVAVIREWLAKAENDFKTAAHTLTLGKEAPTDTICFHAQQCVEKYLKALLVFRDTPFPKTHDIDMLMTLIPARIRPKIETEMKHRLTESATVMRYPNAEPDITLTEARKAVAVARRVRAEIRKHLPSAALRRKKR